MERETAQVPLPIPATGSIAGAARDTGSIAAETAGQAAGGRWLVPARCFRRPCDGGEPVGLFEVGPGAPLPGVGRSRPSSRQDGRWVVVTPKGLIVSER